MKWIEFEKQKPKDKLHQHPVCVVTDGIGFTLYFARYFAEEKAFRLFHDGVAYHGRIDVKYWCELPIFPES